MFDSILSHEGPLSQSDPHYKGSKYNVQIQWSDGSTSMEPLGIIIADDPIECAKYATEHNLLSLPGWKCLKSVAKQHRMISASKSKLHEPTYKFGVQVPSSLQQADQLDIMATASGKMQGSKS